MGSMNQKEIQEQILILALKAASKLGWSQEMLNQVTNDLGYSDGIVQVVFPSGMNQILEVLNQYFDQQMTEKMREIDLANLRVHEKIRQALEMRLMSMQPYYDGLVKISQYYAHPLRLPIMMKGLWHTVDQMWYLANDTSLDYNYYTKRGLLYMVHSTTLAYWMNRGSDDLAPVFDFMNSRLGNVASIPQLKSKIKEIISFGRRGV